MAKKSSMAYVNGPSKQEQDRWQAEDDLRTLLRAKEIQKDKKRLTAARNMAKDQLASATEATKL